MKTKRSEGKLEQMRPKIIFISIILIVVIISIAWYLTRPDYTNLAKCLSSNNVTMYGAEWCSHCNAQKKMFGDAFQYVDFIDCGISKDICVAEGIESYPTWSISGHKVSGEMKADALSKLTGCPVD
jgi:glutaredoxin